MTVRLPWLLAIAITSSVYSAQAYAKPDDAPAPTPSTTPPPAPADPAAREKSRAAFRKGVTQLRAQDWVGARASFEEAWSLVQHPSILLNLGIARLRTDDPVLAEQDLVRFLSEDSGAQPDELQSARDALAEARAKIGTLRIILTPAAARVVIDGKSIAVRPPAEGSTEGVAEARLKAGKHALSVESDGFAPNQRTVDVPAKSESEVHVALATKDASTPKPNPVGPPVHSDGPTTRTIIGWSLAGTAGVALIASGIMGLRAMSLSSDYGDASKSTFQDPDVKSTGITFRTGADVALIVAILAGAGSVVLLFTDLGAQPASASTAARTNPPQTKTWRSTQPLLLRW